MSKYVKLASIEFTTNSIRGRSEANTVILKETEQILTSLKDSGVDLIVTSEAIESNQMVEQAENIDSPGPFLKLYSES